MCTSQKNGNHSFPKSFQRLLEGPFNRSEHFWVFPITKYIQTSNTRIGFDCKSCGFDGELGKKVRVDFLGYVEPVLTPYLPRINPYFFLKTLGLVRKPRVSRTRTEPVLTPYFTRTNPYLNMGSWGALATSF